MQRRRAQNSFRLGLVSLAALALLYVLFLVFTRAWSGHGYRIGVRFANASGLAPGAPVYLSGVTIGSVDDVQILPDNSVEVILTIFNDIDIPTTSRIIIHSSLAGSPDLRIVPPFVRLRPGQTPAPLPPNQVIPKRILPLAQQPVGRPPLDVQELTAQSMGVLNRSSQIMGALRARQTVMAPIMNRARANLIETRDEARALPASLRAQISGEATQAKAQISEALSALRQRDGAKLAVISANLGATSDSMHATLLAAKALHSDPRVQSNVHAAMDNVKSASATAHELSASLRPIAANRQTRFQLLDAQARLRAAFAKLKSLLF